MVVRQFIYDVSAAIFNRLPIPSRGFRRAAVLVTGVVVSGCVAAPPPYYGGYSAPTYGYGGFENGDFPVVLPGYSKRECDYYNRGIQLPSECMTGRMQLVPPGYQLRRYNQ